jgi:hypothetical protein
MFDDFDRGHLHHREVPVCDIDRSFKAVIAFQRMSQLVTDYDMGASGTITPPATWQLALSTTAVGSGASMARNSVWSATVSGSNVNEIGSTTAASYARQAIAKSINQAGIDWGTSTFDNTFATGGQTTTADQVTFGAFSGAPSPNGANSWVLSDGTTLNAGQLYFAGDTAATRTFANGDTEKVTPAIKAG